MSATLCRTRAYQLLDALPDESDIHQFEHAITKMIMSEASLELIRSLEDLLELPPEEVGDPIAYRAFVALGIYHRHMKDRARLETLLDRFEPRFHHNVRHPSFEHFYLLRYVNAPLGDSWESILLRAKEDCASGTAGSFHLFAELIVYHFEHMEDQPDGAALRAKWLPQAQEALAQAISKKQYPKFYCTQGRLYTLIGCFDEAERLIQQAIDLEPSAQQDYILRIGNYQYYLLMAQESRQLSRMKAQMEQYSETLQAETGKIQDSLSKNSEALQAENRKIQDSLIKNIEYLGLFAGIVSFVIGSLTLAGTLTGDSFLGVAGLIVVLFGVLLGVFSGFTLMLHGFKEKRWVAPVLVFAVSVIILLGGLYLCSNV